MNKKKLIVCIVLGIIAIILVIIGHFAFKDLNNVKSTSSQKSNEEIEQKIASPDRIVFKIDGLYYEIFNDNSQYEELVNSIRNTYFINDNETVSEKDVDELKGNYNFIEFDYNKISKNHIFFFDDSNVKWLFMQDDGAICYLNTAEKSDDLKNIGDLARNIVKDRENILYDEALYRANNMYSFLPAVADFKEVKKDDVYVKVLENYEDFKTIIDRYKLSFDTNLNYKELMNRHKFILILSRYDILDYKVNIGNVKINFQGKANIEADSYELIPMIISVGNVTNTNAIYYNYDNVEIVDNRYGQTVSFNGIVRYITQKENVTYYTYSYTEEDDGSLGIIKQNSSTEVVPGSSKIAVGDWISGTAKYVNKIDENGEEVKYEASFINVIPKSEYLASRIKSLENLLESGKLEGVEIVSYNEKNMNSGYVIVGIKFGENSTDYDCYLKIDYDSYTESYLGMGRHIRGDYGIHPHEMVDITLEKPINNLLTSLKATMFEYIAD